MSEYEDIPDIQPFGVQNEGEPVAVDHAEEPVEPVAEPTEPTEEDVEAEKVLAEHEEPKKRSGVARLKAKLEHERTERERLANELAQIRAAQNPQKAQAQYQPSSDIPNENDPKYQVENGWNLYQTDLMAWNRREAIREFKAELAQQSKEQELQTLDQTWKQKLQALQTKDPDFDEADTLQALQSAGVVFGREVAEAVYTSEAGPELLKYLGDNTDEARRINALSPVGAARELGRIEARLVGAVEKVQPKPKTSQAPPPIPPVVARGAAPVTVPRYGKFEDF